MKARTHHDRFTLPAAFNLAVRIALRTDERQRVVVIPKGERNGYRFRVVPVEAPTDSYDPALFANGVTP